MGMKTYLGDSVYAEFDGYGIRLTTDNGDGPSNTIYLEARTYYALTELVEQIRAKNRSVTAAAESDPETKLNDEPEANNDGPLL